MMLRVRALVLLLSALVVSGALASSSALAQSRVRIWNVQLGSPAADLPAEFIIQACGSNGGPPGLVLDGFTEFARCPVDPTTGLYEVWFSYDDIEEYFYKALRAGDELIDGARANVLFEQLVSYSVLIDKEGRVQGYRIISDPREITRRRLEADTIAPLLRNVVFGAFGWNCVDLPPAEGERPFRNQFVKENCEKESNGRRITVESRVLLKPGQQTQRLGEGLQPNEFDVRVRVEVISLSLAR
jgi:hypothetical protein